MQPDLDCLFIHTPKADNHYLPLGDFFNITYMPMGLVALANILRVDGWRGWQCCGHDPRPRTSRARSADFSRQRRSPA